MFFNPSFLLEIAHEQQQDRLAEAETARLARQAGSQPASPVTPESPAEQKVRGVLTAVLHKLQHRTVP